MKMTNKQVSGVGCRVVAALACALCCVAMVAAAVEPASITFTNFRNEAETYADPNYFFEATTLRLTNCVLYAGADTNAARQSLTDVTIQIKVGTTTTNWTYTGNAQVASNGTYWADIIVPTNLPTIFIQTKITDLATNVYIYPWKYLKSKASL